MNSPAELGKELLECLKGCSITITEIRTRRRGGLQFSIKPKDTHPIGGIDVGDNGAVRLWDVMIHRTPDGKNVIIDDFKVDNLQSLKDALMKINKHWESAHGKYNGDS